MGLKCGLKVYIATGTMLVPIMISILGRDVCSLGSNVEFYKLKLIPELCR